MVQWGRFVARALTGLLLSPVSILLSLFEGHLRWSDGHVRLCTPCILVQLDFGSVLREDIQIFDEEANSGLSELGCIHVLVVCHALCLKLLEFLDSVRVF